jgi:hypothetical protein
MTAAATASVEKIVRRVLKQELDTDEKATRKAIQRVSQLLTDEVIPKLEEPVDGDGDDGDAESPSPAPRSFAATETPDDGPGIPEGPDGEDQDDSDVPEAVTQAFEKLYSALTEDRATALATFFSAIGDELRGDDGAHDDGGDTEEEEDDASDDEGEADHG